MRTPLPVTHDIAHTGMVSSLPCVAQTRTLAHCAEMHNVQMKLLAAVGTWLCWEGDSCCITSGLSSLQTDETLPESFANAAVAAQHSQAEHTQTQRS